VGPIGIVCSTCYVKGTATGDLTLTGDFNLHKVIDGVEGDVKNVAKEAVDQLEDYIEDMNFHSLPTLNLSLNLDDLTALPDAQVHFEFDDLELYLGLDIQLSSQSTYTYPLFRSETEVGFSVPGLEVGAVFGVDLVLIADSEVDIGTGIHIKLDDGVGFDLAMFSSNVSDMTMYVILCRSQSSFLTSSALFIVPVDLTSSCLSQSMAKGLFEPP
jgi:hypothetical protein